MSKIRSRACSALLMMPLAAVTVAFSACDDDPIEPGIPVEWTAQLTGAEVEGLASVSATRVAFDATIEIDGAEADAELAWGVFAGTCATPGARVGAESRYPALEVAQDGTAEAEAEVPFRLDEEDPYIVRVLDASGQQTVTVACGTLEVEE